MKDINKRIDPIEELVDYILSHENEDFFDNLDDLNLKTHEKYILKNWNDGYTDMTGAVRRIFSRIAYRFGGHIYATAICIFHEITQDEEA